MFTKKRVRKKNLPRVQKRRKRSFFIVAGATIVLSIGAIGLAYATQERPSILSPLSPDAVASEGSVVDAVRREMAKMNIHPESVRSSSGEIQVLLSNNQMVIMSPNQDVSSQLASLQVITTRLTMEGKRFSRLDLRFDKPVISF